MSGGIYDTSPANTGGQRSSNRKVFQAIPQSTIKKDVGYVSFTDTATLGAAGSQKVLDLATELSTYGANIKPNALRVSNDGKTSLIAMLGYETYSDELTSGNTHFLQVLLKPGESIDPPIQGIINAIADGDTKMLEGTAISNIVPDSNMYTDSTADLDSATASGVIGSATSTTVYLEEYTNATNCAANLFRVGDLIRLSSEIMEVTAIGDKSDLANNYLTVIRGTHGSDASTFHADDHTVRFPFFNIFQDYNTNTVSQTDSSGKFGSLNFFGYGRSQTGSYGITPGSVCLKFYSPGWQGFGLSGISSSTDSGLTASTQYYIKVSIDASTATEIDFTTSATNLRFGGKDGILQKLQEALSAQFVLPTSNLFEKKAFVLLLDGDLVIRSGQNLSTSTIELTAGTTGNGSSTFNLLSSAYGRIPALADLDGAIDAILPADVLYNNIDYTTYPNSNFITYDDGYGRLSGGRATGTINYETGAIRIKGPRSSEFVVSALYNSPMSGRRRTTDANHANINALVSIHANAVNQKLGAKIKIDLF